VDPELLAYLDHHFGDIAHHFDDIARHFDDVARHFDDVDRRFDEVASRFDDADRRFDEVRRHFDVVAESLMSKIELVGEGVRTVDQKLDRFAGEVRGEFERVDRRFLHLTASLSPRRRS